MVAMDLGMDPARFDQAYRYPATEVRIRSDIADGLSSGVDCTRRVQHEAEASAVKISSRQSSSIETMREPAWCGVPRLHD
ncbi:hypothetical protein EEB19_02320 [Gordonia sp. OPL2]|nr:hypothetical protein EEB19_02320 [Gordonia sp. OPL2]